VTIANSLVSEVNNDEHSIDISYHWWRIDQILGSAGDKMSFSVSPRLTESPLAYLFQIDDKKRVTG
jgi:hypothetical protein